jgi:hypothetical protein
MSVKIITGLIHHCQYDSQSKEQMQQTSFAADNISRRERSGKTHTQEDPEWKKKRGGKEEKQWKLNRLSDAATKTIDPFFQRLTGLTFQYDLIIPN